MTPHHLIILLGGYRIVAEAVGRSPSRVHRWQDEGIPPQSWRAVLEAARFRGLPLTLDDIAAMQPAERAKMRRGPRKAAA